jgi:hypothetical protein
MYFREIMSVFDMFLERKMSVSSEIECEFKF